MIASSLTPRRAPLPANQRQLLAVADVAVLYVVTGISAWIIVAPAAWAEDARRTSPRQWRSWAAALAIWVWLTFKALLVTVGALVELPWRPQLTSRRWSLARTRFAPGSRRSGEVGGRR